MAIRALGLCFAVSLCALPARAAGADDAGVEATAPAGTPANAPESPATASTPTPASQTPVATPPTVSPGPTAAAAAEDEAATPATGDSFSSEGSAETEQQHRLDLYGFADMTYTRLLIPKSSPWNRA